MYADIAEIQRMVGIDSALPHNGGNHRYARTFSKSGQLLFGMCNAYSAAYQK